MDKKICQICGTEQAADAIFCGECGSTEMVPVVQPSMQSQPNVQSQPRAQRIFCENCGQGLAADAVFCENCGTKVGQLVAPVAPQMPAEPLMPAEPQATKKSRGPLIALVITLVLLLAAAAGATAYFWYSTSQDNNQEEEEVDKDKEDDEDDENEDDIDETEGETDVTTEVAEDTEYNKYAGYTLDTQAQSVIAELCYYYLYAFSNADGTVSTDSEKSGYTFGVLSLANSSWVEDEIVEYSPESIQVTSTSYASIGIIIPKDDMVSYVESSIGVSVSNYVTNMIGITSQQDIAESWGQEHDIEMLYVEKGDAGTYYLEDVALTSISAIGGDQYKVTGTAVEGFDMGIEYNHEFSFILEQNDASLWYGYTLVEVDSWIITAGEATSDTLEAILTDVSILSTSYLSEATLETFTADDLRILRNAIYAAHGYTFNDEALGEFFSNYFWYSATTDNVDESELNDYEVANRDLIVEMEAEFE